MTPTKQPQAPLTPPCNGGDAPTTSADATSGIETTLTPLAVSKRLMSEGRWAEAEPIRDQMMRECRKQSGMTKEQAQAWTYAELHRMYPPLAETTTPEAAGDGQSPNGESAAAGGLSHAREGQLQGLERIPDDWPSLPDNAPLPAELSWVQAHRLRIVEERPTGATVVHLARAGSPPPSWATLGWLETSIRSYAKFVDICAKGLASQDLESDLVKRERRSIEDVRRLLAETLAAQIG